MKKIFILLAAFSLGQFAVAGDLQILTPRYQCTARDSAGKIYTGLVSTHLATAKTNALNRCSGSGGKSCVIRRCYDINR